MSAYRAIGWCLLSACLIGNQALGANVFKDPLDVPAMQVHDVERGHFSAVTQAGKKLVAVGSGAMIAVSSDQGASWTQVQAPASSDLLALHFATPDQGWAVGHDGLVLHTCDGGLNWVKQFDGRQAARQLIERYSAQVEAGNPEAQALLDGVKLNYQDGPEQALMDVWFADAQNGFIVGTFGTLFATHDGGQTWESWMERVDNPEFLHFLAISGDADNVYIASERGIVFKLDRQQQRFTALQTGYAGSFFAINAAQGRVVAAGLRGSVYSSDDQGQSWRVVPSGINTAFTAMHLMSDGRYLLSSVDGRLMMGDAAMTGFTPVKTARGGRFSSLTQSDERSVVTAGYSGIRVVELN